MKITVNGKVISFSAEIDDIFAIVDRLSPARFDVIILEDETTNSYVQVLSSKYNGIAEARIYDKCNYVHYRAKSVCKSNEKFIILQSACFRMRVKESNLFSTLILKKVLIDFLKTYKLSQRIVWDIVSDEF